MSDQQETSKVRSVAGKLFEDMLVGTVEAIARAGAKALESLTGDAAKVLNREKNKVLSLRDGVAAWRKSQVGEIIDGDVPEDLRG